MLFLMAVAVLFTFWSPSKGESLQHSCVWRKCPALVGVMVLAKLVGLKQ